MTQHYNRPPLNPVHVYIQPVATTRSGGASLNANSTSPYADAAAALRAVGERATHVIIWADGTNPKGANYHMAIEKELLEQLLGGRIRTRCLPRAECSTI